MAEHKKVSEALLSESEATLRLVDTLLNELRSAEEAGMTEDGEIPGVPEGLSRQGSGALATLSEVLTRAYNEIMSALDALKSSREVLKQATAERVHRTEAKLREVSSATELAATDMLNGLDRALKLVDRLDAASERGEDSAAIRNELREEIFRLISCLQFQDITSQQLSYASSMLLDVARRLQVVATLFNIDVSSTEGADEQVEDFEGGAFDSAASMMNAAARQAVADEIFPFPAS